MRGGSGRGGGGYLDCGVWDNDFARVRRRECPQELLVAFWRKGRGLCGVDEDERPASLLRSALSVEWDLGAQLSRRSQLLCREGFVRGPLVLEGRTP